MSVTGIAVISAIALGTLGFAAGCQSKEVLQDRPMIPAPSNEDPTAKQPVLIQPVVAPAPIVVPAAKPAPVKKVDEAVVPK